VRPWLKGSSSTFGADGVQLKCEELREHCINEVGGGCVHLLFPRGVVKGRRKFAFSPGGVVVGERRYVPPPPPCSLFSTSVIDHSYRLKKRATPSIVLHAPRLAAARPKPVNLQSVKKEKPS
jgi:hypothetical protein